MNNLTRTESFITGSQKQQQTNKLCFNFELLLRHIVLQHLRQHSRPDIADELQDNRIRKQNA